MKTAPLSCDGCSMCCTVLAIEHINKPAGKPCIHLVNVTPSRQGCGIYESRPQACATFECLWLSSQKRENPWPKKMRPDKCGVMFMATADSNTVAAHAIDNSAFTRAPARNWINRWLHAGLRVVEVCGTMRRLKFHPSTERIK